MPIYEYECGKCGHRLEIQQKIADAPLKTCPACKKNKLEKLISSTAFVLKGGGWYKDGYGQEKPKRIEKQVTDRLQKAVNEDKAKTAPAEPTKSEAKSDSGSSGGSTPAPSSTPATPSGSSSSGGGSDGGKSSAAPGAA